MDTWEIITTRWYNGDIDREGEPLFRFARNDILDLRDTIKAQKVEIEMLKGLLQRWQNKANDGLIDDTFNGVRSSELEQLIADTKAVLGE